ncbi:alpha/beta fold hydrolase [Pseudomonas syringae]|jgi:pimeloyl-ACP methyl ester carboxylesterase|uniref:Hydrolase n=1 Tax=Pseudomonas syringae TaxID=317 RepID=A0A085UV74_PSESX|nr:alpha/beta hydrolase [Pseudomonas syringae]KFE47087.1 hydrolase [Pseudomonas syringae]
MSCESITCIGRLALGDINLEYRHLPGIPGGRPTLVLLHEGLGCAAQWRDFPERLRSATGCGVLVYSRQGYGRSSPVTRPRGLDYLSHDGPAELACLLDALALHDVVLLGHSDGASIVLFYAALNDPRVRGSIALAPHVLVEAQTLAGVRQTTALWQAGSLREPLTRHHGDNATAAFHGWSDNWLHPDFTLEPLVARLKEIARPLLVIQGRDDQYATAEQLAIIERHVGAAGCCVLLDDCQHFPQREATEQTLQLISDFVLALPDWPALN